MKWRSDSVIVVQPGEKVPIDGIVAEGSFHTEYKCTDRRESYRRMCNCGDEIISGCINMTGVLKDSDNKRIRRIYGIQDSGTGGKCKFPEIKIRELYFKICKILYSGGMLRCGGTGCVCLRWFVYFSWDCHRNGATGSTVGAAGKEAESD